MYIKKFEDCVGWQKAGKLTVNLYKIFKKNRDYSFRDQIQRASVSIMNNIAEGFGRKYKDDWKRFFVTAFGSCAEVRSMLYLAVKLNYIDNRSYKKLLDLNVEISKILSKMIKNFR